MFFEWLYGVDARVLYPATILLIAAAGEIGNRLGLRLSHLERNTGDIGILTGAALGLLALLLAFTFSIALSRYDTRRDVVLAEANAIGSTANFALMLPEPQRSAILDLTRDYGQIRLALGIPYDPEKLARDIAASLDVQSRLWSEAAALSVSEPQSLPLHRFIDSLNDMNNVHEVRLSALRAHVPAEVMFALMIVAMVAIGFAGYNTGSNGSRRRFATLMMAVTIGGLTVIIVDLDRPARGLIRVSVQALVDAVDGMPDASGS